ncbi:MAG: inositol monophosphatase family protein [Spirochaetota bacterium]
MSSHNASLRQTVLALLEGAQAAARAFGEAHTEEVRDEKATDISTRADRELSLFFAEAVARVLPSAQLWSEESGAPRNPRATLTVLVDEIDGTDNFFRGRDLLPWCSVLTIFRGTSPRFGDALAAGIVDHLSGLFWTAEAGGGSYERGAGQAERRLAVSAKGRLDRRSLVIVDHYSAGAKVARLTELNARAWVKDFGSSAFHGALLASGRVDAYVNLSHKAHELGAVLLLTRESGGSLYLVGGSPLEEEGVDMDATWPIVAAQSESLAEAIVELIG